MLLFRLLKQMSENKDKTPSKLKIRKQRSANLPAAKNTDVKAHNYFKYHNPLMKNGKETSNIVVVAGQYQETEVRPF